MCSTIVRIVVCVVGELVCHGSLLVRWVDVVSSRVSSFRSGFGQTARELRGVVGALRSTQGKKRLNELVEQDWTSQMTEARSGELVKAFKFIDSDHSGVRLLCSGHLLACSLAYCI